MSDRPGPPCSPRFAYPNQISNQPTTREGKRDGKRRCPASSLFPSIWAAAPMTCACLRVLGVSPKAAYACLKETEVKDSICTEGIIVATKTRRRDGSSSPPFPYTREMTSFGTYPRSRLHCQPSIHTCPAEYQEKERS